jgi:hypothetical protein
MGLRVIQCHKLLVLIAAKGLCNMMVTIKKNKHMQYMNIKTIHRETQNSKARTLQNAVLWGVIFPLGVHIFYSCKVFN